MRRLAFILLALAWCISASGQAFTPLRPFIFAAPTTGGDGFLYPTNISGLSNWWVWTDMPTNNVQITNWVDRINSAVWYGTNVATKTVTNTYAGVYFFKNPSVEWQQLYGNINLDNLYSTVWLQMSREQTIYYGYLLSGLTGYWYWQNGSRWGYQSGTSINANRYDDPPIGEIFDHTMVVSNTTMRFYTNGVLAFYTNAMSVAMTNWQRMGGTYSENFAEFFGGHVLQMAVWPNVVVSESDLLLLHQYQSYSQPISISTQPASVTCLTNTVVSFSLTCGGGMGYQWRTNGVGLANGAHWSGVNTNVLWVTNDSTTFSNLSVTCVVTNLYYSQTSSAGYLTVYAGWPTFTSGTLSIYEFSDMNKTSGDTLSGVLNGIDSAGRFDLIATNSPVWLTNAGINNGKGFVRLIKASTQNLRTNFSVSFPQPTTVWAVMSNAYAANTAFLDTSGTGVPEQVLYAASSTTIGFHAGGSAQTPNYSYSRWRIWQMCYNGGTSFVNTNNVTFIGASNVGTAGRQGTCIGDGQQGGYPATMDIAFLAIYTNVLSATESNALYFYLSQKFPTAAAP